MKHPDEGRLQALMDDELAQDEARETGAHVDGCAECGRRLQAMSSRAANVASALAALDATPPAARVRQRVLLEAERRGVAGAGGMGAHAPLRGRGADGGADGSPERARRAPSRRWLGIPAEALPRAAAIALLLAGGAAAAALPGSPLRSWIADDGEGAAPEGAEAAPAAIQAQSDEVGVRIAPAEGRLRIVLDGLPAGAEVLVTRISGAATAGVYAPDGARFRSGDGLLEVGTQRGPVRVELPRNVVAIVSVGGRVWVESDVSGLRTPGPLVERDDERALFRVR
ncbi:MAG: hypothetical protein KY453_06200 [Gemmatimonadetes bacterium]|nr:hypothetical protein [Gemmatimonadota bacterium]